MSKRSYRVRLTGKQGTVASCGGERILFGRPDGVGARSDIQDILDGAVAILLLKMSAAQFTARHVGSNDEAAGSRRARREGNSLISTGI